MKVALISRQKLGFATGEIPKPSAGSKEFDTRETCNGHMLSWLFNVVEQKITTTLLYQRFGSHCLVRLTRIAIK